LASIAGSIELPRARSRPLVFGYVVRRLLSALLTLLVIAFLTYWGLTMAQRALAGLPADPVGSAIDAIRLTWLHIVDHPATYLVHQEDTPAILHIGTLLGNSLMLLIPAMVIAFGAGVPLGLAAARGRSRGTSSLIWLISIIGISVPAFMLAMFLWAINIEASRRFNLTPLPATGMGWDTHILLPALVLAARPFAQITQVTYVTISDLIGQDFVRTARGKGVPRRDIDRRHILRNAWIPILTSLSTSLRFALATLPIVEYFFVWPGIGLGLLAAISAGDMTVAVDMVLALGLLFVVVNAALEVAYPVIDPRLAESGGVADIEEHTSLRRTMSEWAARVVEDGQAWMRRRRVGAAARRRTAAPKGPTGAPPLPGVRDQLATAPARSDAAGREMGTLIAQAKSALGRGDRPAARRLARQATRVDPGSEAAWLTLAAVSGPRPSLAYAARALEINPRSETGRRAVRWAVRRCPRTPARASPTPGPRPAIRPARPAFRALSAPATTARQGVGWFLVKDPVFIVAALLGVVLLSLVFFGSRMTGASPYVANGVMKVEGVIAAPPFAPSATFPWGTDYIGRDMQALVLYGARQTLTLAFLIVAARMIVGVLGGMIAGWWKGGAFDRFMMWVISVWAAFPVTLFAMILILALGIEKGMPTFVIALCFVGWGEIAQHVRSEVIALRAKPFLEGARAVGVPPEDVLRRHVLPNLAPTLLVVGPLEMGAVLLLLAELGFLGIYLGGGYRVMIGEVGRMVPVIAHYSDVPEWGALLANIREWWRSYPWLAWSPAIAFAIAILTFNLWGEALRRFLERSRVSPSRWINRTSLAALFVLIAGSAWIFNTTAPLGQYKSQARLFNVDRTMADITELASPAYGGRETGTPGAAAAAQYIADQMQAIGLFPGGSRIKGTPIETYFFHKAAPRLHQTAVPSLVIIGGQGALTYRKDFVEYPLGRPAGGPTSGQVVGMAFGTAPEGTTQPNLGGTVPVGDPYGLRRMELGENILVVREGILPYLPGGESKAILVVADDPKELERRYLFPGFSGLRPGRAPLGPMMMITPQVADQLLATAGSSLADLDRRSSQMGLGEAEATAPGAQIMLDIPVVEGEALEEEYTWVIGYIPGEGAQMGMDSNVILVSAYYDGLGTSPDGTLYPGANDNLSGVATMLELARVLKEGPYAPDKTIVFVAWAGGERWEGFSVVDAMSAKLGFNLLNVEAVLELSGVGGGNGKAIALGQGTSYRLTRLFEAAASRVGAHITTRGTDPHFGLAKPAGFGQRDALSAFVSWDGSDRLVHTPQDDISNIEPTKLRSAGETLSLVLTVLARENQY
jgi:ABC-type dipeptide/oligopeptide/nickel transport system permease component